MLHRAPRDRLAPGFFKRTMIPLCYLHIGTEKTGTTTIQRFLATNRARLREQGVLYPKTPGKENHKGLAAYAIQRTSIPRKAGSIDPVRVREFQETLLTGLDDEVTEVGYRKLLFSNEHLSSRVRSSENVRKVKALCDRYAGCTKVIIYLRNQVDFLVSSYGTVVKSGGSRPFPFPLGHRRQNGMDYEALIAPWSDVFGRENIIVKRFERQDFVEGDLLMDFAATIALDVAGLARVDPINQALSARSLAFLREFNRRVPRFVDGSENPARGDIIGALTRTGTGPSLTVPEVVAGSIMNCFLESNRSVSTRYFNGRFAPLFSAPRYIGETDVESQLSLKLEEALDIAAKLWAEQETATTQSVRRPKKGRKGR